MRGQAGSAFRTMVTFLRRARGERFLQKVLGKVEYIDHFPVHLLLDVFGSAGFKDIVDDQQQLFAAGLGA